VFLGRNGRDLLRAFGQHSVTDVVEIGMHLRGRRLGLGLSSRLGRWVRPKAAMTRVLGGGWQKRNQQNRE